MKTEAEKEDKNADETVSEIYGTTTTTTTTTTNETAESIFV